MALAYDNPPQQHNPFPSNLIKFNWGLDKRVQMYHTANMEPARFTTGDVAAITGIGFEALRQYLKRGQLTFIETESEGGWMRFGEDDLFRIALFAELRKAGISTAEAAAAVTATRLRLAGEEVFLVIFFDFQERGKVQTMTAGVQELGVLVGNAPGSVKAAHVIVLPKLRAGLSKRIEEYEREASR